MKPDDLIAVLIEILGIINGLISLGIVTNVIREELEWLLVGLNKAFHAYGRTKLLVQLITSAAGLVLAVGYQLISVEITVAWAKFVYATWGVTGSFRYTPPLIIILSLVVYLCASIWLREPVERKLHAA